MAALPEPLLRHLRQRGGVTTRRALVVELDMSADRIDGMRRHGLLESAGRGVLALPGSKNTPEHRLRIRVAAAGAGALPGPRASLALAGVEGFALWRDADVVVPLPSPPPARPRSRRGELMVWSGSDETTIRGIRCLNATRSLMALYGILTPKAFRVAFDDARRKRLLIRERAEQRACELESEPGAAGFLAFLVGPDADKESEGERVMDDFLAPLGLVLEFGVADLVPGRRLDALERLTMLGFEYNGRRHHSEPSDLDDDGLRTLECEVSGVRVLVITAGMIRDSGARTLAMIGAIRGQRLAGGRDLSG